MSYKYLFNLCLNTGVKASILILVILVFKRIFKNDFSERWKYYLWIVVTLRLLVPKGPFKNAISLYNMGLYKRLTFSVKNLLIGSIHSLSNEFTIIDKNYEISNFISNNMALNLRDILPHIYIVGLAITAVFVIFLNLLFLKKIKPLTVCNNEELITMLKDCMDLVKMKRTPKVLISSSVYSPFTYGFIKPKIVLPNHLLNELDFSQIKKILLHELIHIKHKDYLISLASMVSCIIHWFNPLVWYILFKIKRDSELACDESVLNILSTSEYKKYAYTLISVLDISRNFSQSTLLNKAFINDRTEANNRILNIVKYRPKRKSVVIISTIILLLITIISFNEDSCNRPLFINKSVVITDLLNLELGMVECKLQAQPIQSFLVYSNNTPYIVMYYDNLGIEYQFWYKSSGDSKKRTFHELTVSSNDGISRNEKKSKALHKATRLYGEACEVKTINSISYYKYKQQDYNITISIDDLTERVYCIILNR